MERKVLSITHLTNRIFISLYCGKMQQILCKSLLAGRAIGILARNLGSGTVSTSQGPASALPLISQFQSRWPKPIDEQLPKQMEPLPRTIPDSKLHFQMKATFAHGSSIFYPHLKFHPSDFKVSLVVSFIFWTKLLLFYSVYAVPAHQHHCYARKSLNQSNCTISITY